MSYPSAAQHVPCRREKGAPSQPPCVRAHVFRGLASPVSCTLQRPGMHPQPLCFFHGLIGWLIERGCRPGTDKTLNPTLLSQKFLTFGATCRILLAQQPLQK